MNRTGFTGTQYTNWTDLNSKIISDSSLYDYLIRPDLIFPDPTNTTYFLDGTHLTEFGNQIIAQNISSYFPTESPKTGLNSTIFVDFSLTFDKLEILDNAITFYNLTYTHPSSCSQQSSYSVYNFTTANFNISTNDFSSIVCPEESSEDSGGSGGGESLIISSVEKSTTIYWSNILSNQEKGSRININGIYLTNISIKTLQNISSASVKIQTLNIQNNLNLFSGLSLNNIFQGIKMNKTGITDRDLNEVSLSFKINNSWIENKNISNIVLQRKSENSSEWEMLNTTYLNQDENYSYFKSFSDGFSYFAIYYNEMENKNNETLTEEETENIASTEEINLWQKNLNEIIFWVIIGIIILIILVIGFILFRFTRGHKVIQKKVK
jgi:PGF-pre-PGF domain-containing protein